MSARKTFSVLVSGMILLALTGCAAPAITDAPPEPGGGMAKETSTPTVSPRNQPPSATQPDVVIASVTPVVPPTQNVDASGGGGVTVATGIAGTAEVGPAITSIPGGGGPTAIPATPEGVPPDTISVTFGDNGKTITLQVGQEFVLYLDMEPMVWTVDITDQSVVSRVTGVMPIKGSQGIFKANRPGQTTLSAVGDPPCRQSTPPCMMPSYGFQIEIVVQ